MPLTDSDSVETIEEGGGMSSPLAESIDYFFALLEEAKLHIKEMQRQAGREQFEVTKLIDRMHDWLDMQETLWDGDIGQLKLATFKNGQMTKSSKGTSTKSTSPQLGRLAGAADAPSESGVGRKRKDK